MTFLGLLLLALPLAASATPLAPLSKRAVPDFALKYAPLSYLHSEEAYFPADVAEHLKHVTAAVDRKTTASSVDFSSIGGLGQDVFLTIREDVGDRPQFFKGGKPDASAHSSGPATIVLVNKPDNVVDAFYFFFYSFNDGGKVLDIEFGDHVGDWEHVMVRFQNEAPQAVYYSAHSGGAAYTYNAVSKQGVRPLAYIGRGSHANYATPGRHNHDVPIPDVLFDDTDATTLWDPTLNFRGFTFDPATQTFASAGGAGSGGDVQDGEGVGWLQFRGAWGDEEYPFLQHGQYCVDLGDLLHECRYVSGPTGPIAKNLGRAAVCQREDDCSVNTSL